MFATIVNRFTLILATAGMLVALFAISGAQNDTVSARTVVIPESSDASTTATPEVPEVRIEYIGGRVRSITEGNSISPRVALTGDSAGGLEQDLVVNFAIKDGATASQSDYSYPSSVTIPAGATSAPFTLRATADDLIEYNETFNLYISSLEYNGESYDTEHAGVEFTIKSTDRIWRTIEKLPSSSWIEGGTANIRIRLTDRLPSDVPANSLFLAIGDGYDDIDITEQLKSSTEVDLSIPLNDNSLRTTNEQLRVGLQFQKSQIPFLSKGGVVRINIADDEEPPQVVVRRNSRVRTSTISEGGRVQLTALAPNVAPVDLVVSLAAGMSTTLASSDYDFPTSVTIPKGQRLVRFWVDTSDDELAEYADLLNIRPTSVVYGSHTHPLHDSGVDLTVNSSDRIGAAVDILGPDRLNEGDTVYIRITVDELLPPETPDGSIYLVLGRRNQASGNSIRADQDDTAGLPVNIVAALKVATSTVVPVELTDDSLIELNERVFVTLAYDREQVPFFRGRVRGRFIVLDNDQTSFSIAPLSRVVYRENEAIELTVELPDGVTSTLDIQIRYRIKLRLRDADGRRVNTVNRDDIAGFLTGTVIIPAGETSAMFRIELTEDQLVEETELLGIRLQRPRVIREDGRTRGLRNAVTSEITVVSVIDNDRPTIKIRPLRRTELVEVSGTSTSLSDLNSATVTEGDSIRLVAEITNAPNGAAAAIALNLGAGDNSTTSFPDDYWFPATVTIPTGAVRAVFTVNTIDDDVAEGDETLNIYIAGVNYGTDSYSPSDSGFDLTILDDDNAEPPVVVPPSQPPVVRVRAVSETVLVEGSSLLLAVELINAPEGGSAETITVQLNRARRLSHTLRGNRSLEYQSVFTIPRGQSRVEFEVTLRDDGLVNDSDVANIYVWSFDYGGEYYRQSDPGVDVTIVDYVNAPVVTVLTRMDPLSSQRFSTVHEGLYSARLYVESYVPNQHPYYYEYWSAGRDIVVHLATRDVTTSESDYSFPSSVTIPRGKKQVEFTVLALNDDLVEFDETFYIYATSVEYRGQTFEQFDPGVRLTIENHDDIIQTSINVSGGIEQLEGTTVTVQVELSEELPAGTPANSVKLAFTPRDNARTVGQLPYVVDITDDLRDSTIVAVPFFLGADYLQEQADLVNLSVVISDDELRQVMPETQSYFRIVADDGQNYEQPDTDADLTIIDNENPPIVTIRQVWPGVLYEEEFERPSNPRWSASELWHLATVFEAVLTNAPSGGTAETITVHLETGDSTTASWYDYSYPSSVTIPQGRSLGRFTIRARDDLPGYYQDEYRETLNVYVSSVDYLGQNYEQSDSGVDLNIIGDEKMRPSVTVLGGDNHPEGSTVTVNIRLRKVLPARIPTGSVKLAISLTGGTRSVAVDGQSHTFEGDEPFVIDITEDLKNSTQVALPLYLVDDDFPGQTGLMKIEWIIAREESIPFSPLQGNSFNPILLENPGPSTFRISDNDGPRVDNDLGPVVNLRTNFPKRPRYFSYGEGRIIQLVLELPNAPEGGATQDITVHLATKNGATASEADYSYPSSVTIPRGRSQVMFEVRLLEDDLPERAEHFEIYVSSVDYAGQNYKQSNAGITVSISSYDDIRSSLTAEPGGIDQVKGRTITVRIELSHPLPPASYDRAIQLSFHLSGSTRFVDATVDGLPFILGLNRWWSILEVSTERFGDSTTLDIPFYLADDGLPEESDLELEIKLPLGFRPGYFNSRYPWDPYTKLSFRIIDNDDLPIVTVRTPQGTEVDEGDTVQLEIELTNAPDGGMAEDITVRLATGSGTTASESDYSYPSSVTIPQGQSRVTFEVSVLQDDLVEDDETLNIYASSVDYNGYNYEQSDTRVDLTIVDDDEPLTAQLNTSELTLQEGQVETIQVDLSGDLSSLVDGDTSVLTIEARPVEDEETGLIRGTSDIYLPAEQNDYELTPVTIDKQASQATFEIRAVEDSDYDPLESVMLELVSHSDDVEVVSPNSLKLKIGDNDPRPFVSFSSTIGTQRLYGGYATTDIPGSSVPEGEQRDFRVVLDRESNRDVEFFIAFSGRPHLFSNDNEELVLPSDYIWIHGYLIEQGYQPGNPLKDWSLLRIPAGELGTTFTVDTRSAENDLYDYYWDRTISFGWLYVDKDDYAYTDRIGARHNFFMAQDEPVPQLLLKSSAADDDGDASITVSEGESFDIWVDISHQLGASVLFDEPDLNLRAKLVATTVSGTVLNLDLPDVLIGPYQSGVTVTVRIPAGSLANDEGTVILALEDVVTTGRDTSIAFVNEISVRVPNRLVVTILDDTSTSPAAPPFGKLRTPLSDLTATLERSLFTLNEGQAATFRIDLDGDLSSLVDGDTTTLAIKDTPFRGGERSQSYEGYSYNYLAADRNDYELTPVTINKQTRQATFGVRAIDEDEFDPLESVRLEVVSRSDDIRVVATNSLRLNIFGNDRRPFISFTTTLTTVRNIDGANTVKIAEGDKGTFGVVLDRKSNRSVEVHIYSNGDFRPFFDENGVDPIRYARTHIGRRYFEDMGFWPGNRSWDDVIGPGPLVIPAGELGLTFTVDTKLLDNDLYDYTQEDYFGTVYLKMNHPVYAYTDEVSSKLHFRVVQDEPTPELSFRSADDGDATITVREGESFDVKIDIDPELGRYHRVWDDILPGVSLASQLTATAVTGEVPAWELPDFEIVPGQPGVTVTVQVPADSLANGERTVVLDFEDALLSYTRSPLTAPARIKNSLVVTILDAEPLTAQLNTSELTLQEGQVATITVDLSGDLSSLVDGDTSVLTINARPVEDEETGLIRGTSDIYLPAEQNDYELTPVTIDKQASQATFEIRAVEDSDYDPLESVMLELVSHSDDIEVGSPNSLKLKIENNDPRPFVSFTTTLTTGRYFDGSTLIKLLEGDKGIFRVVLDRESNRDVELIVWSEKKSLFLLGENGESLLPYDPNDWLGYRVDMGYWPGRSSVEESGLTRIPAGELGLTFTVDTKLLDNDLYDYTQEDYFGTAYIYMINSAYAYTDRSDGRVYFRVLQDEPIPELSFRSADDGDATITVREGESFDVWIDIDPLLGRYHRVWDDILPGVSLASQLMATAVIGEIPAWELPEIEIVPGQPGITVTVQVPADSLSNGERTVVLDFEDALLSYTRNSLTAPARIKNSLVVTILDADTSTSPAAPLSDLTAKLSASSLTLQEGQVETIQIDLSGDLSSLVDGDTSIDH